MPGTGTWLLQETEQFPLYQGLSPWVFESFCPWGLTAFFCIESHDSCVSVCVFLPVWFALQFCAGVVSFWRAKILP